MYGSQNEGRGVVKRGDEKNGDRKMTRIGSVFGASHLMNTSTFRIDFVRNESEVLVEVVKVEHAIGLIMLH